LGTYYITSTSNCLPLYVKSFLSSRFRLCESLEFAHFFRTRSRTLPAPGVCPASARASARWRLPYRQRGRRINPPAGRLHIDARSSTRRQPGDHRRAVESRGAAFFRAKRAVDVSDGRARMDTTLKRTLKRCVRGLSLALAGCLEFVHFGWRLLGCGRQGCPITIRRCMSSLSSGTLISQDPVRHQRAVLGEACSAGSVVIDRTAASAGQQSA
jgi:hypothetical protein